MADSSEFKALMAASSILTDEQRQAMVNIDVGRGLSPYNFVPKMLIYFVFIQRCSHCLT